jgi:hypothetical protein
MGHRWYRGSEKHDRNGDHNQSPFSPALFPVLNCPDNANDGGGKRKEAPKQHHLD